MRIFATLAVTSLIALAGCGGDDSDDTSSNSSGTETTRGYGDDGAAVTQTMKDYFAALASGDGEKACAFFTDDAVKKIEAAGGKCAETVSTGVDTTGTEAYENPTLDAPEVNGESASVHYSLDVKGQKVEADQTLTKEGDDWKLEAATPPGG
jgi:ketosteroid isomerase-like protein